MDEENAFSSDIAIIGMSGRFPHAPDVETFWRNVRDGVESIAHFSEQELIAAGIPATLLQNPHYVRARGAIEDIDLFDAHFFGYLPREAELIDPQQRLFLECAWEAIERAGYDTETFDRRIGIYAGSSMSSYLLVLYAQRQLFETLGSFDALVGNDKDYLATRAAYKLNLRGPAVTVQTACSTSLVAVHLACQSLLNGECDMALAGGVSIGVYQKAGYLYQEGGVYSPDGHCRAFDAQGQGTVGGSGAGVVLLKRMDDAIADADQIHAVIKGFAINNDGSLKAGYTAPSVDGQAEAIREALALARVDPATIGYIEAHGTGTALGDPIEAAALTQVFRSSTDKTGFCALGSVKTNIGHLDAAAGVAGLIKTVFALKHRQIPPSLHFRTPNPQIDFASTPFYVSADLAEWPSNGSPRRAGVSSFGIGGTNAHVVLEEAPDPIPSDPSRAWQILPLSAKTATALEAASANLAAHLRENPNESLADIAYTLQVGRRAFERRQILVCRDRDGALDALDAPGAGGAFRAVSGAHERSAAFLFPGGGAQYVNMGRELYAEEPIFRAAIDRCAAILRPLLGLDPREALYPDERRKTKDEGSPTTFAGHPSWNEPDGAQIRSGAQGEEERRDDTAKLSSFVLRPSAGDEVPSDDLARPGLALPALFSVEYALAQQLIAWGADPAAMIGHSLGEYVAACLAGVFSLEDALACVVLRGRLFENLPQGGMISVAAHADAIRPLLGPNLSIAAINSPSQCVVSGAHAAIEEFAALLDQRAIDFQRIKIDVAAHSQLVDQILPRFVAWMQSVTLQPPGIPFISNVTGTWITNDQATSPAYWGQHLRETVRFADGVAALMQNPNLVLVEVGPGRTLATLAQAQTDAARGPAPIATLRGRRGDQPDQALLLTALGRLWLSGVKVDWAALYPDERRERVQLPTYPFERRHYWIDAPADAPAEPQPAAAPSHAPHPAHPHPRPDLPTEFVAPRDERERAIALIWQDCLGIGPIGARDNFFDLGGHSLLATQVVSRVRDAFQVSLPLRRLFEDPTVAGLARQVERARQGAGAAGPPLVPQPRGEHPPLSFAQQRLWFLDQLAPNSPLYNVAAAIRLSGRLDLEALAYSLGAAAQRHESLRTTFALAGDEPTQEIAASLAVPLPLADLRALPAGARADLAAQLTAAEARAPFDLGIGPLIRTRILRLGETEHLLLLTMHHIISDGWSQGVLIREIGEFYAARQERRAADLPDLPIQYADYAVWQRAWLQGDALDAQLAYWKARLADAPLLLNLPTDRPRPATLSFAGATLPFALDAARTAELHALSRQHNATLFMTLLAAFQALLARYGGQGDIVVGTPISGRNNAATEPLIGCFLNTLALRSEIAAGASFADLLDQVRTTCLDAYAHQDLPFEQLVEALDTPRSLSATPLVQVMFVLQNTPIDPPALPGLALQAVTVASETAKFDIALSLVETPGGLAGTWEYSTDLFDAATIARASVHFATLLGAVAADPGRSVARLPLMGASECAQVLVEWSGSPPTQRREACLHELLADQAARSPDAVALVARDGQLTYQALNARANQIARRLRRMGVGPEDPVGVSVGRSSLLAVALLGVLKAGGCYVPLDPAYPPERIRFMAEDSRTRIIIYDLRLTVCDLEESQAPVANRTSEIVDLGAEWASIAQEPAANLPTSALAASQLAYLIYTSGSTGTPKAVMIEQRQLADILLTLRSTLGLIADDVLPCIASCAFDIFMFQLWGALLAGGRTVLLEQAQTLDMEQFTRILRDTTVLEAVPSLLRQLADHLRARREARAYRRLRLVMPGGDQIPPDLLDDLARVFPDATIHPTYGPTESAIMATAYRLPRGERGERPLLGRPLGNRAVWILDAQLQPAPIGVAGEVYIGGFGVSRGYWRRPDLTAERFAPNPFGTMNDEDRTMNEPESSFIVHRSSFGARLYRTGDLARYRPDGVIEFLGRADHQVKLRGFRIELGEIAAALSEHPAVREVAVIARQDAPGAARLVAYIVLGSGVGGRGSGDPASEILIPDPRSPIAALREWLAARLPEYMIPAAFVELGALPLTPNGKLDRRALPAPSGERPTLDSGFAAPRTPAEQALAAIWRQALGVAEVGVHDNFFALGGDSILSIQIIARARQAGIQLSPRQIFEHQTIAALAAVAQVAPAPISEQGEASGPVPLTPVQRWFFEQLFPAPQHWNQALLFTVREATDPLQLSQALHILAERHDALRLRFTATESGWRQENAGSSAAALALDWIDLSALPSERRSAAITRAADDLHARLDLARGPIGRAALFDLGPGEPGRLLLILHHLVVDGVSWRVLLEDLQTAYAQIRAGRAVALPPRTSSFRTWAQRLAGFADDPALRAELAYWRALPWERVAPLPLDSAAYPGANSVEGARSVAVALSAEETDALLHEVPPVYRTRIDEALLGALGLALARWTGSDALLIDMEGHGREDLFDDLDVSRTVGWFTAVAPLLLDLRGADDPGSALKAAKEQLRRRPRHGVGYGILRYLSEDATVRDALYAHPQAQVSFNYLGRLDQALAGPALLAPAPEPAGAAQSPLAARAYQLDIVASVFEERLRVNIAYGAALHQHATIARLADGFIGALRELIAHCREPGAGGYTPSDFPQIALGQPALDRLLASVAPGPIEDIYPLAPMQEGMLFHHLYDAVQEVYFEQMSCTIDGRMDEAAFAQSWAAVIARHAVLRTALTWEDPAQPLQVVYERVALPLDVQDWRMLPAPEQERELAAYQADERARGFDLRRAPLMRLALIRLADERRRLIWSHHHILMDGWCLPVLLREVLSCYAAFGRGSAPDLPAAAPYGSYIAWLRKQDLAAAEAYWRGALAGFTDPTPLPLDAGAHAGEAQWYADAWAHLDAELSAQLQRFARQQRVTLNTLAQGAWARILSGYSGARDVVFGATVAGRPPDLPGIESMIGLFINTLPVRVRMAPGARVAAWLQELQAQQAELRQYEYSPLAHVQGWSDAPRGRALFESLEVFENYPTEAGLLGQASGLTIGEIVAKEQTNYPLTLLAAERDARLTLRLSYQTQRFDAAGMARILAQMAVVLEGMAAAPDRLVEDLPILTEAEREQALVAWNATAAEYPRDALLGDLFAAQAARSPDAVALACTDDERRTGRSQGSGIRDQDDPTPVAHFWPLTSEPWHLSYAALDQRANQLAHHLRARGVGPEVCAGVYAERSLALAVGMLAILKAGGSYVPLDPAYPSERIRFMLEDSGATVILTNDEGPETKDERRRTNGSAEHSFVLGPSSFVDLRADWPQIAQQPADPPVSGAAPDTLAYVIYTSGSTGKPKGAMVEQRGMINHLYAKIGDLGLRANDIVAQTASQNFDISVWQFLAALLVGGRVQIYPNEVAFDPDRLLAHAARDRVTVLQTVPSLLRALLETQAASGPARGGRTALRWLAPTGEALPPDLARAWLRAFPATPLINAYGPTECSDDVTHHVIAAPPAPDTVRMPIGRPVANTRIYLLDARLRPVPVGAAGELYVGGDGVGRGYLNRPDLTAAAFVPNSFGTMNDEDRTMKGPDSSFIVQRSSFGTRLYRTGDLARYQPDGVIEFLGRIDHQVKLRGYRIELGEVEAALADHPAVRESVVLARADAAGGARLVAYVVTSNELQVTSSSGSSHTDTPTNDDAVPSSFVLRPSSLIDELRAFLKDRLPEYMVPSAFVALGALPLTPNGKVDRRALPAPDADLEGAAASYVAPRTPTEEQLARIWTEVLGRERVGRDENFFDLGGHSLLATQVIVRVRHVFGVDLPLRELFAHPTVAGMAEAIVRARAEQQDRDELERLLAELEDLSEEETQQLLAQDE